MPPVSADLVLRNGTVWCGRHDPVAEAIAVWQGRVLATGTSTEIAGFAGPETEVIELEGRIATPGLNDSHLHLISVGLLSAWVDARPAAAPTLANLLSALRERASKLPPGQWVLARGYDQTKLGPRRHPLREELDQAVPDHPVMLVRTCGHIAVCKWHPTDFTVRRLEALAVK